MALAGGSPVAFEDAYSYRVSPRASGGMTMLRSDGTGLLTAPNVDPYTYEFTVLCFRPGP